MLRKANEIILTNIPRNKFCTKAGVYCNNPRVTQFQEKTYYYQQPDDMQEAVSVLLDRFNSLLAQSMNSNELLHILKCVAWLVFELLDLHPFSDGNGRLCRLLCSYVLSTCTPFPTPICSHEVTPILQSSVTRHPVKLTSIIIERTRLLPPGNLLRDIQLN